jgi:hypothetical protein
MHIRTGLAYFQWDSTGAWSAGFCKSGTYKISPGYYPAYEYRPFSEYIAKITADQTWDSNIAEALIAHAKQAGVELSNLPKL